MIKLEDIPHYKSSAVEDKKPQQTPPQTTHYIHYEKGLVVDRIDPKNLIDETKLKIFGTICPREIFSVTKMEHVTRQLFEYFHLNNTTNEPTQMVYSQETNSKYYHDGTKERITDKSIVVPLHIHFVANVPYSTHHKENIYTIVENNLGKNSVSPYTVIVVPYLFGVGSGLDYTIKEKYHVGTYQQNKKQIIPKKPFK